MSVTFTALLHNLHICYQIIHNTKPCDCPTLLNHDCFQVQATEDLTYCRLPSTCLMQNSPMICPKISTLINPEGGTELF